MRAESDPSLLVASRQDVELPPWRTVRQSLPHRGLPSVVQAVRQQFARADVRAAVPAGSRVAIAVGSRGVARIDEIVREVVLSLRALGAEPFIVPAMGSHGGGTAHGQTQVLAALGISERTMGAPVRAGMETEEIGVVLDGVPVHVDRIALMEADLVVPVARVKPHTDFRGPLESGLHKMLAIGLGKHRGATALHSFPLDRFGELVPVVGALVRAGICVPFGIAVVEDGYEQPAIIEAVLDAGMPAREAELLELAKEWLPRLPFAAADILVVQAIGKEISGAGMDPNVTGRFPINNIKPDVSVTSLVVLDLTESTHGNASEIGMADITTTRAAGKIDWTSTYTNCVAARCAVGVRSQDLRIAWVPNTLEVAELRVSEPLWQSMQPRSGLEVLSEPEAVCFDDRGALLA
jgi:hypothetical protein